MGYFEALIQISVPGGTSGFPISIGNKNAMRQGPDINEFDPDPDNVCIDDIGATVSELDRVSVSQSSVQFGRINLLGIALGNGA